MEEPFTFRPKIFIEENVDMDAHYYGLLPFGTRCNIYTIAKLGVNLVYSMLGYMFHHIIGETPKEMRVEGRYLTLSPRFVNFMVSCLDVISIPQFHTHINK